MIRLSIRLNFAGGEKVDDTEDEAEMEPSPRKGIFHGSIVSKISVVCMIGVMITQGLQNSQINEYKCDCSDADIDMMRSFETLAFCTPNATCVNGDGAVSDDMTCLYGRCIKNAKAGYPCLNPRYNHKVCSSRLSV